MTEANVFGNNRRDRIGEGDGVLQALELAHDHRVDVGEVLEDVAWRFEVRGVHLRCDIGLGNFSR